MKKRIILPVLIILFSVSTFAQQKETGIVKLRGTRLTYPLIKKWVAEFNKEYPRINVVIAPKSPADSIDFSVAAYGLTEKDYQGNRSGVAVTRYVQLPVANSKHPGLASLQAKGFTESDFNALYFASSSAGRFDASHAPITLYTREKPACAAITFAKHFGNDAKELKGVGVKGDDQDLASAVKEDVNGLSFNNLGFIYDVKTRKVIDGLAVVPLDLNENGKVDKNEQLYETLDKVISYIEKTNHPKFITERVNFIFSKSSSNQAAGIFLSWVLTKGQTFNHALGFLSLEEKTISEQKAITQATFKIASTSSCEGADKLMAKRRAK